MAQPASSPKIEELRFRIKTDPKSRLFYPLAEELRKIQQHAEAEQVLRLGLTVHPTYLSAWVSLGRVLREQGKNAEAVEPLSKALQLDPGNVVAARALADAYLALGEKVEAIKKYKLVHALLPADQDLAALIAQLDREINPQPPSVVEPLTLSEPEPVAAAVDPWSERAPARATLPPIPTLETPFGDVEVFSDSASNQNQGIAIEPGEAAPIPAAHSDSPFAEPAAGYPGDAFGISQPGGWNIGGAPESSAPALFEDQPSPAAEASSTVPEPPVAEPETETSDFFAPSEVHEPQAASEESYVETGIASDLPFALESTLPPLAPDDFAKTITMADLYAGQGLIDEARDIYEDVLARDPSNELGRAKLEALSAAPQHHPETYEESEYEQESAAEPTTSSHASASTAFESSVFEPAGFESDQDQPSVTPTL